MSADTSARIALRPASAADIDLLAAIHEQAACAAYGHAFPPGTPFPRATARTDILGQLTRAGSRALIAAIDGADAGFAIMGPTADRGAAGATGEIHLLHVRPAYWGRGIGRPLLDAATAALVGDGHAGAILWVLVSNARARRFYEREGWAADGATAIERHGVPIEVMRYRRDF